MKRRFRRSGKNPRAQRKQQKNNILLCFNPWGALLNPYKNTLPIRPVILSRAMKKERQIGVRIGLTAFFALEVEGVYRHTQGAHRALAFPDILGLEAYRKGNSLGNDGRWRPNCLTPLNLSACKKQVLFIAHSTIVLHIGYRKIPLKP
jgi:hypothetical protein